jgi:putative intracellular protease/amidase
MKIDILLFPGFQELDAIAPFEVLQNAAQCGAEFEVRLVALSGAVENVGTHGARLWAEAKFDVSSRPDVLVVPGGGWIGRAPQGARAEAERGDIPRVIAEMHKAGTVVAAVCTGTMLLAAAGLIKGRPVTTHHGAISELPATGAQSD